MDVDLVADNFDAAHCVHCGRCLDLVLYLSSDFFSVCFSFDSPLIFFIIKLPLVLYESTGRNLLKKHELKYAMEKKTAEKIEAFSRMSNDKSNENHDWKYRR